MKKLLNLLCVCVLSFSYSCNDNNTVTEYYAYKINEPVFMEADAFRKSVKVSTVPQEIQQQGKICFYKSYLYISEPEKGIHIINNSDPANPRNIGFIELLGNADISIRNDQLYADSYIDLVWFDVNDPAKPELKGRLEDVFTHSLPNIIENNYGYDSEMCFGEKRNGIVVGWKLVERTEKYTHRKDDIYYDMISSPSSNSGGAESSNGKNGSMSRFSIYKDYLYIVINNSMSIIDLSNEAPIQAAGNIYIGWDVETIFSYKENMFMGTPTGMLIYSVEDPLNPIYQSALQHVYGCDPVVVENDMAYVTIHSGNFCGQDNNELFIVDVSDVKNPKQIVSYTMTKPKGLGIDNGTLFVCDDGLKVFRSEDPQKLMSNMLVHHKGMEGFDVIPYNNVLIMIADDGLYQYDYSNLQDIKQISKLAIARK